MISATILLSKFRACSVEILSHPHVSLKGNVLIRLIQILKPNSLLVSHSNFLLNLCKVYPLSSLRKNVRRDKNVLENEVMRLRWLVNETKCNRYSMMPLRALTSGRSPVNLRRQPFQFNLQCQLSENMNREFPYSISFSRALYLNTLRHPLLPRRLSWIPLTTSLAF